MPFDSSIQDPVSTNTSDSNSLLRPALPARLSRSDRRSWRRRRRIRAQRKPGIR